MITPDTKIEFFEPCVRTHLILMQHDIKTVQDLLAIRDEDLCLWRNATERNMDEIHSMQEKARSLMGGLRETSGHLLRVGDHVRMNIEVIGNGDLDGVEFTNSGKDYWRYMNQHPEEVYTVTGIDCENEECPYILSGYMGDNTWASDELILLPEPTTLFEEIKNMRVDQLAGFLCAVMDDESKFTMVRDRLLSPP